MINAMLYSVLRRLNSAVHPAVVIASPREEQNLRMRNFPETRPTSKISATQTMKLLNTNNVELSWLLHKSKYQGHQKCTNIWLQSSDSHLAKQQLHFDASISMKSTTYDPSSRHAWEET